MRALVITSINEPTPAIIKLAEKTKQLGIFEERELTILNCFLDECDKII